MKPKILVITGISGLFACYTGATSQYSTASSPTNGVSSSTTSEDAATTGVDNMDAGGEESDDGMMRIDDFLLGKDLLFRVPPGWFFSDRERAVAVASFAPPHTSDSGEPEGGQIINILAYVPSLASGTEETTSLENWRRNSRPEIGSSVVFFVNHDLGIGIAGEQTDGKPLDTTTLEMVVESISLVAQRYAEQRQLIQALAAKVLTLPFADNAVYIKQGWIYDWDPNKNHGGIDYKKGKPGEWLTFDVVAAYDGSLECKWSNSYGNVCYVKHTVDQSTFYTVYAHLEPPIKTSGDIKRGEKIAAAGKTGTGANGLVHLHFEIQMDEVCNQMYCRTDPYAINKMFDSYPGGANFSGLGAGHWWANDPPLPPGQQVPDPPDPPDLPCDAVNHWEPPLVTAISEPGIQANGTIPVALRVEVREQGAQLETRVCKLEGNFLENINISVYDEDYSNAGLYHSNAIVEGSPCTSWYEIHNIEYVGSQANLAWEIFSPGSSAWAWSGDGWPNFPTPLNC